MKKLAAILCGLLLPVFLLLCADTYAHRKFDQFGGLNRWGYRGAVVGMKTSDEYRVIVLGGSTAFGAGVRYWESWPAQLEQILTSPHPPDRWPNVGRSQIRVINLGYNSEGSYAMLPTLQDYDWLEPDLVLLYEGYNDLGSYNTNVYRHESFVFRHTGYLPLLDLVIREKIMSLRSDGLLDAAYRGEKTVFHMTRLQEVTATGLSVAQVTMKALDRQLNGAHVGASHVDVERDSPTQWYLQNIDNALWWCVGHGYHAIVIGQPIISETHRDQQRRLAAHLHAHSYTPYVDLGSLIDLHDTSLVLDGMHLNVKGNRLIAEAVKPAVLDAWEHAIH